MTVNKFVPTIHPWNQELWQSLTAEPERSSHALLFTGNRGLGKKSLAVALAHFLMCDNHSQSESLFNAGSHPDFHVLMPEIIANEYLQQENIIGNFAQRYLEQHSGKPKKVISIEQVRKLTQTLTTHPHISQIRIVLIISSESMNSNAANALLKNLEEPPANTLFILVSDEIARLPKTIRSRCNLLNFRAPEVAISRAWLQQQNVIPAEQVNNHLAMANNYPLMAIELYQNQYVDSLKSIFTDVNSLWNGKVDAVQVANNWQKMGAISVVEVLQKLTTDLARTILSTPNDINAEAVFFPVQQPWILSTCKKLSKKRLFDIVDELNYAKSMLATTVDELLVLETLSNQIRKLPS